MRKRLLVICFALVPILWGALAQAQRHDPDCTANSCIRNRVKVISPVTPRAVNQISAALQGSLLSADTLSATTTSTRTIPKASPGSAFDTASLGGNTVADAPAKAGISNPTGGKGIPQTSPNTGFNALQQSFLASTLTGIGGFPSPVR
jgi:hypothetical protein